MSGAGWDSIGSRSQAVGFTLLLSAIGVGLVEAAHAWAPPLQGGTPKTVYAIAVDADNKPVTDLKKQEWGVREDGTDRTVVDLKQATDPIDVVLLIDTTKTATVSIGDLRTGLQAFATTLFGGSAPVTLSTTDVSKSSFPVAKDQKSADDANKTLAKTLADQSQSTVFVEALADAAKKLAKSPTARRAIVVVNMDGVPENSTLDPQVAIRGIVGCAASLWVVTYQNSDTKGLTLRMGAAGSASAVADAQGAASTSNLGTSRDAVLARVPTPTGGLRLQVPSSALSDALKTIASALVGQYTVTYTRPDGPMPRIVQMAGSRPGVNLVYPSVPVK